MKGRRGAAPDPIAHAREQAERTAVAALAFLAADRERIARFLDASGIAPWDLRGAAADPRFLAGVLEHLMADESLLLSFAANAGLPPADVAAAARRLSGGSPERPGRSDD